MKALVELSPYLENVKKPIKKATTFSRELNNRSRKKKYVKENLNLKNIHHGQRKLLLSEIEFLTIEYDKWKNKKDIILLYVGAAEGYHTEMLIKLFPEFEYHLYDEREFYDKLYDNKKVKIFNKYFDNKIAKTYKNKNVIFICDIRALDIRNAIKKEIKNQNNVVSQDMTWQQEWYNIIKPITALFKFRLPWTSGKTKYLDGRIFYQVWQGQHSTETRLIPNGKMKEYENTAYEERLFYFNTETRRKVYTDKLVFNDKVKDLKCYGHSYDSMSEAFILYNYLTVIKDKKSKINFEICKLGREISSSLKESGIKFPFIYEDTVLKMFKI